MGLARLLLVDDNPDFLKLARHMLEPHFHVVGALADGESALRSATFLFPDIILLDISLGDHNGFEVSRRLRLLGCTAKIVFFSVHEDPAFVEAAIVAGASGYIFKSRARADLLPALRQVHIGGKFFPPHCSEAESPSAGQGL
jgi:DNA-binding NarL/FixJ family response regulator